LFDEVFCFFFNLNFLHGRDYPWINVEVIGK
jgi:hypothetical protein